MMTFKAFYSYENTRKTWNTDSIIVCQNLIGVLDAATSSGILKAKQKLGRTFNSDKLGGIAFTKISRLTMCSA